LLVAACVVPNSPILVTLMKETPGSSETSVLTRATRRNIPEDTILHIHRRENLKSYLTVDVWMFVFGTYQGTSTVMHKTSDWNSFKIFIFEVEAAPHSCIT
jgi:hypothetical protein